MDNAHTAPFGPSDLNSADGMSATDLQKMFGFTASEFQTWETKGASSLQDVSNASDGMEASSILRTTIEKFGSFDSVISSYINGIVSGRVKPTDNIPPGGRLWVKVKV
jgi:hypothetical protein